MSFLISYFAMQSCNRPNTQMEVNPAQQLMKIKLRISSTLQSHKPIGSMHVHCQRVPRRSRSCESAVGEFVLEIKYRLENNCEIKGLGPVVPTLDHPEFLQKLRILNSCIKKKKEEMHHHQLLILPRHKNQRIKISNEITILFHKSALMQKRFPDDDASKVLCWLASVNPSEMVLRFMPMLIYSAVTALLKHPVSRIGFKKDLVVRNKVIEQCPSNFL